MSYTSPGVPETSMEAVRENEQIINEFRIKRSLANFLDLNKSKTLMHSHAAYN